MIRKVTRLPLRRASGWMLILLAAVAGLLLALLTHLMSDGGEGHGGEGFPVVGDTEWVWFILPLLAIPLLIAFAPRLGRGLGALRGLAALRGRRRPVIRSAELPLETELRILAMAKESGAPLTVPEVALHCRISLTDSKRALRSFAELGFAHAQVTEHGDLEYVISGLRREPSPLADEERPGSGESKAGEASQGQTPFPFQYASQRLRDWRRAQIRRRDS